MTSSAFWAYGSKLKMGDGAVSESFSTIAELNDIEITRSRDSIDVTSEDSSNGWREFIPGWRDAEVTCDGNWVPADATQDSSTGVASQFGDDDNHNYQIVLPDGTTTISFAGHVTKFDTKLPREDKGNFSATIKISGAVTCNV